MTSEQILILKLATESRKVKELLDVIAQRNAEISEIREQWGEQAQRDGELLKKLRHQIDEFHQGIKRLNHKQGSVTDSRYWDCECEQDYIWEKTVTLNCEKCGASHDEQPDSRASEVNIQFT